MGREQESEAAEVERLTKLRDEAEKGSPEHRELNHELIKARRLRKADRLVVTTFCRAKRG